MELGRSWPAFVAVLATAILIAPLWAVDLPAMPDIPAHLACFYLLGGGIRDPQLAHFYRVDWQFVPNLAAEATVPFLSRFIGLVPATKLFLSASVAAWVMGAAAVQRVLFGRIGPATLLAAFFAYNANFFWGFMNYDFAAGLDLVLFAAWIGTATWSRLSRDLMFAAAVTLLYFCHVFAAAVLLLMIGCYELDRILRDKSFSLAGIAPTFFDMLALGAPSALAFFVLRPHAADGGHLEFNILSTWQDRLGAAFQSHFDEPGYVMLAVLALVWGAGVWRGWLRVHPSMRVVLFVLVACVIFMPEWALGGWGVDLRMPPLLGAVAFAATEFVLPERRRWAVAGVALVALSFSAAAAGGNWAYYDRQYAEFRAALKSVPKGTLMMTALDGDAMGLASDEPYWHMAEYNILDRSGFSPYLFTTAGQHVVRVQPQFQPIVAATAQQGSPPDVGELSDLAAGQANGDEDIPVEYPYLMRFQCYYDYLVVIRSGGKPGPVPDMLRLRYRGSFFDLYDVHRDANCTRS